ncbi:MAG: sterol desaturase family protein [Cyclobacteriaceae bacterium]|nr:sterol desaturase family protein [Cyclobacteriaceae bacterium HetDA_MAG_MS6]
MEELARLPFWQLSGILFLAVVFRYFLLAALFQYIFSPVRKRWQQRKVSPVDPGSAQFKYEIFWSICTSFIFAIIAALMLKAWVLGYTRLYTSIEDFGWLYLLLSIPAALLLHETQYYWLHRWMHRPGIFKWVHKVHHKSLQTSAWTAFSFHPSEGLIQMLMIAFILMVLPVHYGVLLLLLVIMTISSIVNHLGIDIYPRSGVFRKHVIGASHHSVHHSHFNHNYGLYFTFWDRWMGTEFDKF